MAGYKQTDSKKVGLSVVCRGQSQCPAVFTQSPVHSRASWLWLSGESMGVFVIPWQGVLGFLLWGGQAKAFTGRLLWIFLTLQTISLHQDITGHLG